MKRMIRNGLPAFALAVALCPLCAGTTRGEERGLKKVSTVPESARPTLSVRANLVDHGRAEPLLAGTGVRTGQLLEFYAYLSGPAYLYVLQFHPDGTAQVLYPDGNQAVRATGETRIPEPGSSFELVGEPGDEKVFFVASALPLAEADGRLKDAVERVQTLSEDPAPTPSAEPPRQPGLARPGVVAQTRPALPPPTEFGLATRGRLVKVHTGPVASAEGVAAGEDGIAIFQFTFHHIPDDK